MAAWRLDFFAVLLAASYLALAVYSNSAEVLVYPVLSLLVVSFLILLCLSRFPRLLELLTPTRFWCWTLIYVALGLSGQPVFEDDYFRYLWDGHQLANGINPYLLAPSVFFDNTGLGQDFQLILGQINYPDIRTIYGPVLQWSFVLAYWVSPGEVWPLQLIYSLCFLGLVAALVHLCGYRHTLWLAWSPLVFKEIILTAHPDIFAVLLLMLAVIFHRQNNMTLCATLLALSIAGKIFAVLLLPFLMLKAKLRHWLIFIAVLGALYLPFMTYGDGLSGLEAMANGWEYNSVIFILLLSFLPAVWVKLILACLLLSVFGFYWNRYRKNENQLIRGDLLFGLFLLCSPVINPWYLIWLLPFAVIYSSCSIWVASAFVLLSYVNGLNLGSFELSPFQHPAWVKPIEFGVICLTIVWEYGLKTKRWAGIQSKGE